MKTIINANENTKHKRGSQITNLDGRYFNLLIIYLKAPTLTKKFAL